MYEIPSTKNYFDNLNQIVGQLKPTGKYGAKMFAYVTALGAIVAIGGTHIAPELTLLVEGVGINILSNLIERIGNDEIISEEKIQDAVEDAIDASKIDQLLTANEFYKVIGRLKRGQDILEFAVKDAEYTLSQKLDELSSITKENQTRPDLSSTSLDTTSPMLTAINMETFMEVQVEVENIWHAALELQSADAPYMFVLRKYRDALLIAQSKHERFPTNPYLEGLSRIANYKLSEARRSFEVSSTAEEMGDYMALLEIYEATSMPYVYVAKLTTKLSRQEAIWYVCQQAEDFAFRKATEYLKQAQHVILESPKLADELVDKGLELFMLSVETKYRLLTFQRKEIFPAIARRKKAENLLRKASAQADAQKGLAIIEQVRQIDSSTPDLEAVEQVLIRRSSRG